MSKLFDSFPFIGDEMIVIDKMTASDTDALIEISDNENVYRFIPPFLHKKSRGNIMAYVMPENICSAKVLLANGFEKVPDQAEGHDWGQRENVMLDLYRYTVKCAQCGAA